MISITYLCETMSSIDKAVMLEVLGWSRCGKNDNYLPDDIVNIIHQFTFFDVRTKAYQEHLERQRIQAHKQCVLDHMMEQINVGLKRYGTGEYGIEYNLINIGSNCCMVCGEFVNTWEQLPEKNKCSCRFISEEEIMDYEHQRDDNFFWEEELDAERDRERRKKNQYFNKKIDEQFDENVYSFEDDPYSDRKPNWDEGSVSSLDYDYCDDDNSYF